MYNMVSYASPPDYRQKKLLLPVNGKEQQLVSTTGGNCYALTAAAALKSCKPQDQA